MYSNQVGDEGFQAILHAGDTTNYEDRLAGMAASDSAQAANGLHTRLEPISSWRHDEDLRKVRKYRSGGHRFYVKGRHTDCRYTVIYVKVNKKAEVDPEESGRFQGKILRALQAPGSRLLQVSDFAD
jgi:hypothetical protein